MIQGCWEYTSLTKYIGSFIITALHISIEVPKEGLFTIVNKPSFGTSIEICNAVIMKLPIYFVSEVYSQHPWIKVYADYKFKNLNVIWI